MPPAGIRHPALPEDLVLRLLGQCCSRDMQYDSVDINHHCSLYLKKGCFDLYQLRSWHAESAAFLLKPVAVSQSDLYSTAV